MSVLILAAQGLIPQDPQITKYPHTVQEGNHPEICSEAPQGVQRGAEAL
jgi:hypothetical protein